MAYSDKPGSWDALNTSSLFPSSNSLQIPDLNPAPLSAIPDYLSPYGARVRAEGVILSEQVGVHFFRDDYRFERVWKSPLKSLQSVARYKATLTPDFSIYADWPRAVNIWNIYRTRWLGRFWAEKGCQVIPHVSWGAVETWEYCFLGLPLRSVLAISTIGIDLKDPTSKNLLLAGFAEMTKLAPIAVLVHGTIPSELYSSVDFEIIEYPTIMGWKTLHPRKETV